MPSCAIIQCRARKSKDLPNLTCQRFPKNPVLRQKWLDAIGLWNINPRVKVPFICSLHFEESDINRTQNVVRLRKNAVPTKMLPKSKPVPAPPVVSFFGNVAEEQATEMSDQGNELLPIYEMPSSPDTDQDCILQDEVIQEEQPRRVILIPADAQPSSSSAVGQARTSRKKFILLRRRLQAAENQKISVPDKYAVLQQSTRVQKLEKICQEQKKKIKRLREQIRRQGKKIEDLKDILKDLLED